MYDVSVATLNSCYGSINIVFRISGDFLYSVNLQYYQILPCYFNHFELTPLQQLTPDIKRVVLSPGF